MAILVRELQENGKMKEKYLSIQIVTQKKRIAADALDEKIKQLMTSIEAEAKKKGLMALKAKRKDVIKLYYFIGTELKPFVDGLKLPKGDKHHIWNPINYHAKRLKLEGEVRLKRGQGFSNTWNNCYLLTKYKESDVFEYEFKLNVNIKNTILLTLDDIRKL